MQTSKGFFTNHSLRRTGGTRLFRTGVDHKLVKEATGHRSDSVDDYQITSDEQCECMCKIIAEALSSTVCFNPENQVKSVKSDESKQVESNVSTFHASEFVTKLPEKQVKSVKSDESKQVESNVSTSHVVKL